MSGSDLVVPLVERAAARGWRVFLLGGGPGVGELAAANLKQLHPGAQHRGDGGPDDRHRRRSRRRDAAIAADIAATRPDLVLVALRRPKQEIFCDEVRDVLAPAVLVGIGAGHRLRGRHRAPRAALDLHGRPRVGLPVGPEPRRLAGRYLLRDPEFLAICARQWWRGAEGAIRARFRAPVRAATGVLTSPSCTTVTGNITGLKPSQKHALERVYRRRLRPVGGRLGRAGDLPVRTSRARSSGRSASWSTGAATIEHVFVGDASRINLPEIGRLRAGRGRFRGLRLVHTHLRNEPLTRDDLVDLALLRLDLVAAIGVQPDGRPADLHVAHLLPPVEGQAALARAAERAVPPQRRSTRRR